MKRKIALVMVGMMLMAGCNEADSTESGTVSNEDVSKGSNDAETESKEVLIDVADIDWHVEPGIIDGDRRIVFWYTNNTDYDIIDLEMKFKLKDGLNENESIQLIIDKYSETIKKGFQDRKDKNDIDVKNIMTAEFHKTVKKGESSEKDGCNVFGSAVYVIDESVYEMTEPDIMTIKYIDDENIYESYYDFKSKETTNGNVRKMSTSQLREYGIKEQIEIKKLIPEIDFGNIDTEENDRIIVNNCTEEQFKAYAEKCKSAGWSLTNEEQSDEEDYTHLQYWFKSSDGLYELIISREESKKYDSKRCWISIKDSYGV